MLTGKNKRDGEIVVVLHGIGRTAKNLWLITLSLRLKGYRVLPISYPSRSHNLDGLAQWLRQTHLTPDFWTIHQKVHFVTHSMGGLLARRYLHVFRPDIPVEKIGRVVMLGTPNGGSEIADFLKNIKLYKWFFGKAGQELVTDHQSTIQEPVYFDVGIIAGRARWPYPAAYFLIKGQSDGLVAVDRTKIDGMKDHITLFTSHGPMVIRPVVIQNILAFLENGEFKHDRS